MRETYTLSSPLQAALVHGMDSVKSVNQAVMNGLAELLGIHFEDYRMLEILSNCRKLSRGLLVFPIQWSDHIQCHFLVQDTRYSSVLPISRILFTPPAKTATGVRPNSVRSAEISKAESNTS
jgi:D-Tyr-tRNAtyr deacylase